MFSQLSDSETTMANDRLPSLHLLFAGIDFNLLELITAQIISVSILADEYKMYAVWKQTYLIRLLENGMK